MRIVLSMLFMCLYINVAQSDIKIMPVRELSRIDKLIKAVQLVESNNNPLAVNVKEQATGSLQIRPIRLKDYNRKTGSNYKLEQMHQDSIAVKVFLYYAEKIGVENHEMICRKWNGGSKNYDCKMAEKYWNKVQTKFKEI